MCEKPMAKTYKEAVAMCEAAERTGKKLTIGYQNRNTAQNLYVKACADKGEFGEIYYGKALAIRRRAVPTWGVFLNEYEQGGGPLIDIGTHALDMTLWVMNNYEPEMVVGQTFRKLADKEEQGNAWGNWDPEKFTVEDSAFGFIKMKNGAVINLESSWALNIADYHEASYMICGDLGGADTINDQARLNYIKHQRQCIEIPDLDAGGAAFFAAKSDGSPAEIEAANWINAILTDTDPVVLPRQALVVTRILEAIYESAKTGKPVYFD
jgi:predicted dehydrogenase